ncbi:MAG: hypothetical protein Q9223_006029 [Gallowayella weberi]
MSSREVFPSAQITQERTSTHLIPNPLLKKLPKPRRKPIPMFPPKPLVQGRPSIVSPTSSFLRSSHTQPHTIELQPVSPSPKNPDTTSVYTLARTHQPRSPSPLITFAPDSPPFSPISLTSTPSSLAIDLSATLKPLPARSSPQTTAPAPSTRPPPYIDYLAMDPTPRRTRFRDLDLESGGHNIYGNESENLEACMPSGYPYHSWQDYGQLAMEWLRSMGSLLMSLMEQQHRWGGARRTI